MDPKEARSKSFAMWEAVASAWERYRDFVWGSTHAVSEWMISRLDPQPGQTILELAAGPGETGFAVARRIGDSGHLICSDWSPQMLEVARRRAAELGLGNVEFRILDAEKIDLPDDSVDGVACRWGYMLMQDPAAAMSETRRVLRAGGKLVFSVWGSREQNLWAGRLTMALVSLGKVEYFDPTARGGMLSLGRAELVEDLVVEAGFNKPDIEEIEVHWKYPSFDAYCEYQTDNAGPLGEAIGALSEEEMDRVRTELKEFADRFRSGDGYEFPGVALNAVAS